MSRNPSLLIPADFSPVPYPRSTPSTSRRSPTLDAPAWTPSRWSCPPTATCPRDLGADLDRDGAEPPPASTARPARRLVVPRERRTGAGARRCRARPAGSTRPRCGTPRPSAARATATIGGRLGIRVPSTDRVARRTAGQVRHRGRTARPLPVHRPAGTTHPEKPLTRLVLALDGADADEVADGASDRRCVTSRAAAVARDLANSPPAHLTATAHGRRGGRARRASTASRSSRSARTQLVEMGCGGLLGVNAGSTEEPRMVELPLRARRARPPGTSGWSARGSCTTPAASASSRRTRCTC